MDKECSEDEWAQINGTQEFTNVIALQFQKKGLNAIWSMAYVKWDGCIDLNHYSDASYEHGKERNNHSRDGYLHICDLKSHIEEMQLLLKKSRELFGDDWE